MDIVRLIFVLLGCCVFALPGILSYYYVDGGKGRAKLQNPYLAEEDAHITELEPVSMGHKQSAHFELIVHFSDGTSYRDICNERHFAYYKIDKAQAPAVVKDAIAAHNKAVRKKLGSNMK